MTERTLVLIKPDAVEKDVWLDIIKMYERHGLRIDKTRILSPMPFPLAQSLYHEHVGKSFYEDLLIFMARGITIALCVAGLNAIALVRAINGATKPSEAVEGTVRKMYGTEGPQNAVHGSADYDAAQRELDLIFGR